MTQLDRIEAMLKKLLAKDKPKRRRKSPRMPSDQEVLERIINRK